MRAIVNHDHLTTIIIVFFFGESKLFFLDSFVNHRQPNRIHFDLKKHKTFLSLSNDLGLIKTSKWEIG